MLTAADITELRGLLLGNLVPSTVDMFMPSDDVNMDLFFDNPSDKTSLLYADSHNTNTLDSNSQPYESQCGDPVNGLPVQDLLDLENFEASWRSDASDPDWTPQIQQIASTLGQSPQSTPPTPATITTVTTPSSPHSPPQTSRPAKRRRNTSSSTSEQEIQIEIEESSKRAKRCTANLTEEQKKVRRKELNRLAAQRCRSKRRGHAEILEQEIEELTVKNRELKDRLEKLTSTKNELYEVIKFHFSKCHGGPVTTNAASSS